MTKENSPIADTNMISMRWNQGAGGSPAAGQWTPLVKATIILLAIAATLSASIYFVGAILTIVGLAALATILRCTVNIVRAVADLLDGPAGRRP